MHSERKKSENRKGQPDPNDRRSYVISITEQGRTVLQQAGQIVAEANAQFVEALTTDELEQLTKLLVKLLKGTQGN